MSVVIASYNPKWEKMQFTLDTIIPQKGIEYEIIITDDGSKESLFAETVSYLVKHNIYDFTYVLHEDNQGTTKNIYDGVKVSKGKYIKPIGTGDALASKSSLRDWCSYLHGTGKKWSFADYKCFVPTDLGIRFESHMAHPTIIDCYLKGNEAQCRINYLLFLDLACGAATLVEREYALTYLAKIEGVSRLTEDFMYRLMVLDGNMPSFYNEICVLYEWGEGVSTKVNSPYSRQMQQDERNVNELIYSTISSEDALYRQVRKAYWKRNRLPLKVWRFARFFDKGYLRFWLKLHFNCRVTKV